jgi:hypothetical protein
MAVVLCYLAFGSPQVYAETPGVSICDGEIFGIRISSITHGVTKATVTCLEDTPEEQLQSCETRSAGLIETATMAVMLSRGNPARLEWSVVGGKNICTAIEIQSFAPR